LSRWSPIEPAARPSAIDAATTATPKAIATKVAPISTPSGNRRPANHAQANNGGPRIVRISSVRSEYHMEGHSKRLGRTREASRRRRLKCGGFNDYSSQKSKAHRDLRTDNELLTLGKCLLDFV
jgi:hypothetical protein